MYYLWQLRVPVSRGHSAPAHDYWPPPRRRQHRQVGERIRRQALPQPRAQWQRPWLLRGRAPEVHREECAAVLRWHAGILLLARLHGRIRPQGREIVLALARVLRHAGVTFGVLRKEKCTGDPARRLGNDLAISQVAEANIETLRAAKVNKIVSICPHCVRTIGTDWQEYGGAFDIEHHSELLERVQSRLPARDSSREKTVFHDPCYLGRYRNIYEEPREIVGRTSDVIDPHRARERSFCCGAGGGQMFLGEEKGKRVNLERAEELVATGAQVVGTACPFCQSMFRDTLGNVTKHPPQLLDIAQIVAASLPAEPLQGPSEPMSA